MKRRTNIPNIAYLLYVAEISLQCGYCACLSWLREITMGGGNFQDKSINTEGTSRNSGFLHRFHDELELLRDCFEISGGDSELVRATPGPS
jgi:hypothetical protein